LTGRHLPFIEEGPHGVFLHDPARGRSWPTCRAQLASLSNASRAASRIIERIGRAAGREKQRLTMEYLP
jgi:hypothetical protein